MYIIIHESGDMVLVDALTADDLRAADDGILDLLDVSQADRPLRYEDQIWAELEVPNG